MRKYKKWIWLFAMLIFFTACNGSIKGPTSFQDSSQTQIKYLFSGEGQRPDKELISLINSAKSSVDIAIYSITKKNIVNAIITAANRGIKVRVISDNECSQNKYQQAALYKILKAGIVIKVNTHRGLMHLKVTLVDNRYVTTGSYNYTDSATYNNDEVFIILKDSNIALDFEKEFNRMWTDTSKFKLYK